MWAENLCPMPALLKSGKLRPRIPRKLAKRPHHLDGRRIVFIIRGCCGENRPLRMLRDEIYSGDISRARQQDQRLDLGMPLGQLDHVVDAATAAAGGNPLVVYSGLSDEELVSRVKITRPFLVQLVHLLRRRTFKPRPTALSKPPVVDGESVDSLLAQSDCDGLPRLPGCVAHVQQQYSRAWFIRGKQRGPQLDSIGRRNVDVFARAGLANCQAGEWEEEKQRQDEAMHGHSLPKSRAGV